MFSTFFFWGGGDSLALPLLAQSATAPASSPTPLPSVTAIATPIAADATPAATPLPDSRSTQSLDELERFNGIPVGFTVDGDPFMGDPNAPVVMHEYSDYLCPFCGRHFRETLPSLIEEYIRTGKLLLVFHDFPIPALHPTAPIGHRAGLCVAEQGLVSFWSMHDALFERQSEWNQLADPTEFLAGVAEEIGVVMDDYTDCMDSGRTTPLLEQGIEAGKALGYNATPSFRLVRPSDDYSFAISGAYPISRFREVIDALAAGEEAPAERTPEPPQLPYWAAAGLAADPDRPGFTLAGDPYKGSETAPLTIVEFSDFQCPACAKQVQDVQPVIDRLYLKTGKVRWVFKNYPLREHAQALVAASAAECAGEQQVFWEFHDALFADPERWAVDDVDGELIGIADEVGLDIKEFASCLAGRKALERVVADMYDAQGTIDSTPTFVGLHNGLGALYRGGRDLEATKSMLDGLLELLVASSELPED